MTSTTSTLTPPPLAHTDRFFIGGEWVAPASDTRIDVIDSATEELFFSVAEAQADDIDRAVAAARQAFDTGPWPRTTPAEREQDAVRIANDTIYGLNASVFTPDADRAREVAGQLRSGTVGHNAFRTDFGIAFGGFKQSGIGREGGKEGLLAFLESKTVVLDGKPRGYS